MLGGGDYIRTYICIQRQIQVLTSQKLIMSLPRANRVRIWVSLGIAGLKLSSNKLGLGLTA